MADATLYDRLGGEDAITATVAMFYERIMTDDALAPFFAELDMDKQIHKQIAFMTMAFGGPHAYTGQDLRSAHAGSVARGLNEAHFTAVAGHLQATLETLAVPAELIAEVMTIVGGTKDAVLGR